MIDVYVYCMEQCFTQLSCDIIGVIILGGSK